MTCAGGWRDVPPAHDQALTLPLPVLRPRLQDLAIQPHLAQHRFAALLRSMLHTVAEEALGLREVLVLGGRLPEVVAGPRGVACFARLIEGGFCRGGVAI